MTIETAKELASRNHKVDIISYPGTFLTKEEEELGIKIHPVDRINYPCFKAEPYNATLASQAVNLFLKEDRKIDIIHAHYAITHGDAALTAREIIKTKGGDPKVVITSHGSDIHTNGYHNLLAPSIEYILKSADAITFVSKSLQQEAQKLFDLDHQGEVVYNFVNENKFVRPTQKQRELAREHENIPLDAFVIYHASNFRQTKNTKMLVESLRKMHKGGTNNAYLLLVGDGPEKSELQDLTIEYKLSDKVRFVGRKENVVPYLHASDVSVLCSIRESFGLSLLEGMSCGLPALGSKIGGIPEVISHGNGGYVFEKGNMDEMNYFLKKLATDQGLLREQGDFAHAKSREKFNRRDTIQQYEDLYYRLKG